MIVEDSERAFWERRAKDYHHAMGVFGRLLRPGGKLVAPTFCHDETRVSWIVSGVLAAIGQPMHRRFTVASLQETLEGAGLRIGKAETIPGLIPVGYVEGMLPA